MVTDLVFRVITLVPMLLLNSMSSVSVSISETFFNGLHLLLGNLGYIFPVAGLFPILFFSVTIKGAQIAWALIIRIKSFIPTMGA